MSPEVAVTNGGHKTPCYQPEEAPITLHGYTHALSGELERAHDLLDEFLAERVTGKRSHG